MWRSMSECGKANAALHFVRQCVQYDATAEQAAVRDARSGVVAGVSEMIGMTQDEGLLPKCAWLKQIWATAP
jgi:hypothetical protein